jgi:hypothetical protein
MGRVLIEILTCDRKTCGKEFKNRSEYSYDDVYTVDGIKYMRKRNGSGSARSDMSAMLCPECSAEFFKFMTGEDIEDY